MGSLQFSVGEVEKALLNLDANKGPDPDKIPVPLCLLCFLCLNCRIGNCVSSEIKVISGVPLGSLIRLALRLLSCFDHRLGRNFRQQTVLQESHRRNHCKRARHAGFHKAFVQRSQRSLHCKFSECIARTFKAGIRFLCLAKFVKFALRRLGWDKIILDYSG
jgi:hypothetical protein